MATEAAAVFIDEEEALSGIMIKNASDYRRIHISSSCVAHLSLGLWMTFGKITLLTFVCMSADMFFHTSSGQISSCNVSDVLSSSDMMNRSPRVFWVFPGCSLVSQPGGESSIGSSCF